MSQAEYTYFNPSSSCDLGYIYTTRRGLKDGILEYRPKVRNEDLC